MWKRSFSKLIQKNVFLFNSCSKRKYVTYSYMHARDWSLLLECGMYFLTFFCIFFFSIWILAAPPNSILIFNKLMWGCSCTYQPDLWWCSLWSTEVYTDSCWKHHWLLGSQSCTACELGGYAQPRGVGSGRGGGARSQHCRHTVNTFPAQAGTSYRWHCRRCLPGHPSPVDRSIPVQVRFRSQLRWHCVVQKEPLEKGGTGWNRTVWKENEFNFHAQ